MGLTFRLGQIPLGVFTDASNNVGIGAAPSGSYKLEVTGTAKVSSTLLVSGAATFSSSVTAGSLIVNQASTAADIILKFAIAGTPKWLVGLTNDVVDDNFTIYQDGAGGGNRFTINTSGNVGIGISAPVGKLHVFRNGLSAVIGKMSDANILIDSADYGVNTYTSQIAFGYYSGTFTYAPVAIGFISTSGSGAGRGDLTFNTRDTTTDVAPTERMRITSGGNVLIGTTTDSGQKLHIAGNILNTVTADTLVHRVTGAGSGYCYSYWTNTSGNLIYGVEGSTAAQLQAGSSAYDAVITTASATGLSLGIAQQQYFRITSTGVIRLTALTSNGTVSTQSSNGSLYVSSDANLKIEDGFVENGLEKVLALKPRYFYWKDKEAFSADRQLGFYAQEVNTISEETANTPAEGCGWGIYDRGLVALLTKAIQEQQAMITSLQDRLEKAGL